MRWQKLVVFQLLRTPSSRTCTRRCALPIESAVSRVVFGCVVRDDVGKVMCGCVVRDVKRI